MKAMTTLRSARPSYTPALVALAALHESHGAFLGGNFFDCGKCRFHAHNGSDGTAVEHDPNYNFTRTYAIESGNLKIIDRRQRPAEQLAPSYVELFDALEVIANGGPFPADLAQLPSRERWVTFAKRILAGSSG